MRTRVFIFIALSPQKRVCNYARLWDSLRQKLLHRAHITMQTCVLHSCVYIVRGDRYCRGYMYDYIKSMKIPVHTHVEGLVASAATLLTVGGKHRTMSRHSMMLFHQASLPVREDLLPYSELRDNTVNLHKCMDALIDIYSETSKLDKDSVKQLLGNEQFLTAQECMQCGFIDEITR
jgi:hypothetical protein